MGLLQVVQQIMWTGMENIVSQSEIWKEKKFWSLVRPWNYGEYTI